MKKEETNTERYEREARERKAMLDKLKHGARITVTVRHLDKGRNQGTVTAIGTLERVVVRRKLLMPVGIETRLRSVDVATVQIGRHYYCVHVESFHRKTFEVTLNFEDGMRVKRYVEKEAA